MGVVDGCYCVGGCEAEADDGWGEHWHLTVDVELRVWNEWEFLRATSVENAAELNEHDGGASLSGEGFLESFTAVSDDNTASSLVDRMKSDSPRLSASPFSRRCSPCRRV